MQGPDLPHVNPTQAPQIYAEDGEAASAMERDRALQSPGSCRRRMFSLNNQIAPSPRFLPQTLMVTTTPKTRMLYFVRYGLHDQKLFNLALHFSMIVEKVPYASQKRAS